jgi:hypothetical protein
MKAILNSIRKTTIIIILVKLDHFKWINIKRIRTTENYHPIFLTYINKLKDGLLTVDFTNLILYMNIRNTCLGII